MDLFNTKKALKVWTDIVIDRAKRELIRKDKNASGKLMESLKSGEPIYKDGVLSTDIQMENYGVFVDKGVSGIKKKYNTPYSYKSKMPPTKKLDKWSVRRGIAPRDAKGKFIPRKSVLFAIARGIYMNGMKPTLFLTTPFNRMKKELPVSLTTAFTEDAKAVLTIEINK